MVVQISGSVGLSGKNKQADVSAVQGLLNLVPGNLGGPDKPIAVDGLIGPETIITITRFQSKNFGWGDGRVDPTGQTLSRLNDYADMAHPSGPLASMTNKPGNLPKPGGNSVDNYTTDYATIISIHGTAVTTNGPAKSGDLLFRGTMIWTGKNSALALAMSNGRKVFVPSSSMLIVGNNAAVPLEKMQYSKNGAAPYTSKSQGHGVSPGYFHQ